MAKKRRRVKPEPVEKPKQLFVDRYPYIILLTILSLALLLRILALLSLKGSLYFDFLMYDERVYHNWAAKLADGTFASSSVYEMAPLPAYFMALIYKLFSPDVIYIRIANIILGVLTCWLVYLIVKELSNRTIGLIACLVAALYKPFIFYSIVPLNTALSVFLFALTCYLLAAVISKSSMIRIFLLGIAICLAYNVRPNCLVLIPVIFALLAWNAYKDRYPLKRIAMILILYTAGVAVVQSPFMIRNYMVAGEASATPSQSGLNLFICNNLQYGYPVPFASTVPSEMGIQFTIEASRRVGKKLSSGEASRYWTGEVIRTALEQPGVFTWKQVKKLLGVFNWSDKGDHYDIGFVSDFARFFKFPFPGFWLILPFGMTGMILNMLKGRKEFALSAMFITYALTLIAFFSNSRVWLPLLVVLIPFAVLGADNLRSHIKDREPRSVVIYLAVLAGFFIIEFLPVRDTKDMTNHLNAYAIILNSKGMEDEAIEYWEKSSNLEKHYSDFANLSLGNKYYSKGEREKAFYYLNKISDESYAAPYKYEMIGDIMVREGQTDKAVTAYEKALDINSGLRTSRAKLVKVLWSTDRQKALEENDRLEYINSFYTLYGVKDK
jgi:4-amino-4-deoxy-L-arabinose transferase-like glycosyltransferase